MRIDHVSAKADHLIVTWEDGQQSQFHYVWLRENCATGLHPVVGERTLDPLDIPLDITAHEVSLADSGEVAIEWAHDGHHSVFDPGWLYAHTYEPERIAARKFRPTFWDTEYIMANLPQAAYASIMADDAGLLSWLWQIRKYGFCIVRDAPTEPGEVGRVAERIAYLRPTNYETIFNVETKPDPDSVAYTAVKLNAHTDLVSREAQPGLQFLHCLVFDAEGGESILIDGHCVAQELKERHPEHYELLTTTAVRFRYHSRDTDITWKSPMIRLDADGDVWEIRYSTALLAPLDIAPELVMPFYAAYHAFTRLLRDPAFEYQFRLTAGDIMVFDNRRVLHGRTEFNPQSGHRHLQGCYIDGDDFLSRIRVLERTLGTE